VDYLERLGLKSVKDGDILDVTIPTYRLDLGIEADLIEEIEDCMASTMFLQSLRRSSN